MQNRTHGIVNGATRARIHMRDVYADEVYKEMREQTYLVLTALAGGRRHGYALIKDVEELSDGRVVLRAGSLYAMVERLVSEGLVAPAGEEVVHGRLRRYYALSDAGSHELRAVAERMATAARATLGRLEIASPRLATRSILSREVAG